MKTYNLIALLILLSSGTVFATTGIFFDHFNNGIINSSLWDIGGAARGTWDDSPIGEGDWTFSHEESDTYLKMMVKGPTSGNTYGAEAWIMTTHNYNDGGSSLLNIVWEAEVLTRATDYMLQVTDGYIPDPGANNWYQYKIDGTYNLLWGTPTQSFLRVNPNTETTYSNSITIDSSGVARLYNGLNASGSLLHEEFLDMTKPWYVRGMVTCATSAGFPAGESYMNIDYLESIPEPATILLLTLGGIALMKKRG